MIPRVNLVRYDIFGGAMNRVFWFIICTLVGLELIAWGLLVPIHLGAIDATALARVGASGPSIIDEGVALLKEEQTGPARLMLQAADQRSLPGRERLATGLKELEEAQPRLRLWGGPALYLETIFERNPPSTNWQSQPIVDLLIPGAVRATLLQALARSHHPGALEILKSREYTNAVIFPPALSASGQPLDATILLTALLLQQDQLATPLRNAIQAQVAAANRGTNLQPVELTYLDFFTLGKRLNWGQLVHLLKRAQDTNALRAAAVLIREREAQLPLVFAAIHSADSARSVGKYLESFPKTGLKDLSYALGLGSRAAGRLLMDQTPVHYPTVRQSVIQYGLVRAIYEPLARLTIDHRPLAAMLKYTLYVLGVLLLARAIMYLSPSLLAELVAQRPVVNGPQVVIGLCLLFIMLFFTESLVTRATPAASAPLRVKFPVASPALRAKVPHQSRAMNFDTFSAASLVIFFVLQAAIYVACRMKLGEIRRQTLPSRLKLRLLENEENLFDAGLYFGFVGTVISLILVSMGVAKFSMMVGYSSTSFGIIFVSILKIFHVRPFRRRLILDSEISERQVQPA